jgi:hypothetical protein
LSLSNSNNGILRAPKLGGDLVQYSHHSILIEVPLAGKPSWENDLSLAQCVQPTRNSTNSHIYPQKKSILKASQLKFRTGTIRSKVLKWLKGYLIYIALLVFQPRTLLFSKLATSAYLLSTS